jgi:hypothetical protein
MAVDPGLVVSLEARLDKFEKQLKSAGVIADREVSAIEQRFARSNPQFNGSFLGNFLSNFATKGLEKAVDLVQDMVRQFRELESVSKLVSVSMNDLFGLQKASGAPVDQVTQSVRALATLLDQMKRGEENSLSKLFDVNPQALQGVNREALTFQQTLAIISDLVQNARTEIQKIDIAKAAGQAEAMVPFLEKGAAETQKLQKAAADAAPDLQRLANSAKEFDQLWSTAVNNIKHLIVEGLLADIKSSLVTISDYAIKFLSLFEGGLLSSQASQASKAWQDLRNSIVNASEAQKRVLEQAPAGNLPGAAGTTTLNSKRGLSNVPLATAGSGEANRFDRATDTLEKRLAGLNAEAEAINHGTAARERARIAAELETVAKQVNGTVTAEQRAQIDRLAESYGRVAEKIERAQSPLATFARESKNLEKQLNQFAASSLDGLTNSLADIVTGSKSAADAFKALADQIINDLVRIAIRQAITGPLAGALFGGFGGGAASSITVGNQSFPKFAGGTDFAPGGMALVGERGPELVNLPRGSQVIPNHVARAGGSSGGVVVNLIEDSSRQYQPDGAAMRVLSLNFRQACSRRNPARCRSSC